MTPTQLDNSKIIAEFMGLEFTELENLGPRFLVKKYWTPINQLKYHTSWDALMNVVETIEQMQGDYIVSIEANYCVISQNGEAPIAEYQGYKTKIENVFNAVVDFIIWHNSQNEN